MRFGRFTVGGGFVLYWLALFWWSEAMPLFLAAALLHELGHWLAVRLAGGRVCAVRLSLIGADMRADALSYPAEMAVTLAGPLTSLCLGAVCSFLGQALASETAYYFAGINLVLGAFNLLPARTLDGGRVLYLALCWCRGMVVADRVALVCDIACAALLTAIGYFSFLQTKSLLSLMLTVGFFVSVLYTTDG